MSNELSWIFFPIAITLHNIEEAIWLPKWSTQGHRFQKPIEANEFYFAVIIVTIIAYLASFFAILFPDSWFWTHFFHGFLGAMILNTFMPHLASTIVLRKYSPGLISGLFLLLPINSVILYQSVTFGIIQIVDLFLSIIIVSAFLLTLLPFLFRISKFVIRKMGI